MYMLRLPYLHDLYDLRGAYSFQDLVANHSYIHEIRRKYQGHEQPHQ